MKKILVIGDCCIDVYNYVRNSGRSNPEMPGSFVYTKIIEQSFEGMSLNVENGLDLLDFDVYSSEEQNNYSTKTRIVDIDTNKVLLRYDLDLKASPFGLKEAKGYRFHNGVEYDAVVVSDYCKGRVTDETLKLVQSYYKGPKFLDTKKKELSFLDGWIIKQNTEEAAMSSPGLNEKNDLYVTMGPNGIMRITRDYLTEWQPAFPTKVVDVCGAGDAALVGLIYGYFKDGTSSTMMYYAAKAGAACVEHMGVYMPTLKEIES